MLLKANSGAMTQGPVGTGVEICGEIAGAEPNLEQQSGSELYDKYLQARNEAIERKSELSEERLDEIRTEIGRRVEQSGIISRPDYNAIDEEVFATKWGWLAAQLKEVAPEIHASEYEATKLFGRSSFALYNETPEEGQHPDANGSFAFLVPIRMDRQHEEYGSEVEEVIPLSRYLPNKQRARMLVGLSPCIIDRYEPDETGGRGYLVFVPVYNDETIDLQNKWRFAAGFARESWSRKEWPTLARMKSFGKAVIEAAKDRANDKINKSVDFAHRRLGAKVVGLGAVLPAISEYGTKIKNEDVITTTGHGGTVHLIQETLNSVVEQEVGKAKELKTIGILGCGSIGSSIAHILAEQYKETDMHIVLYDSRKESLERTKRDLVEIGISEDRITVAANEAEILEGSQVVVSAITSTLKLDKVRHKNGRRPDLKDLVVIDDSQPGSITLEDAKKHGVNLVWVIGEQHNGTEPLRRERFTYGRTMQTNRHLFGCEGEAGTLAMYYRELIRGGETEEMALRIVGGLALREAVRPTKVQAIAHIFKHFKIGAARLQSFGQDLDLAA